MGVAFYILFLLIASPVKKEDACKTTKEKPGKTVGGPPEHTSPVISNVNDGNGNQGSVTPTVILDTNVLKEYEYSDAKTMKWSVQPPNQFRVTKFDIRVSSDRFQISGSRECTDHSTRDCFSYQIPSKLDPGQYKVDLKVSVSKDGETKELEDSGSLKVKNPLRIIGPDDLHVYEQGESVLVQWLITDTKLQVQTFKISIWDANHPESDPVHTAFKQSHETRCEFDSVAPNEHSYQWAIDIIFTGGGNLRSPVRYFDVVKIPTPEVNPPLQKSYGQSDEIIIDWSIEGPTDRIDSYEILVWELGSDKVEKGDPTPHQVTCGDIQECKEYKLKLPSGRYRCKVKFTTRNGQVKRSENYRDIQVRGAATPVTLME